MAIESKSLKLFFDGSCEPRNPGGVCTSGFVIFAENGELIHEESRVTAPAGSPLSTNNYAEYCALGLGLRWLADQRWQGDLAIFGDSQLVVNQVTRAWACNKEHLQVLRKRCWELLDQLGGSFTISWIPREENEHADSLSRKAYCEATGKAYPVRIRK